MRTSFDNTVSMNFIDHVVSYFTGEDKTTDQSDPSSGKIKKRPYRKMPPAAANAEFQHRHGHGGGGWESNGWGWENPVYSQQGQTSPAVSALALLGFLFFLNLIQSSLSLNRQLMTTTVITANASAGAGAGATAQGRDTREDSGQTRGERQRRGIEGIFNGFNNKTDQEFLSALSSQPVRHLFASLQNPNSTLVYPPAHGQPELNQLENPIAALPEDSAITPGNEDTESNVRIVSLLSSSSSWSWKRCIQLLMCNLGQRIYSSMGRESRTVLAINLIGQHILSTFTPKTGLASQVARALMVGYRSRKDCSQIYKQCKILSGAVDGKQQYNPILEAHVN